MRSYARNHLSLSADFRLHTVLRSPEPKLSLLWGYIRDRSSISICIAILVFAAADIFEGGGFGIPRSELAEEILEVIAFCYILRAAFLVTSNSQKT